jgi:hypothetical protein
MLTFRQVQRLLHRSNEKEVYLEHKQQQTVLQLVRFLSGCDPAENGSIIPDVLRAGCLGMDCTCDDCTAAFTDLIGGDRLKKLVDAMARKFGPNKSVESFLNSLLQQQPENRAAGGDEEPAEDEDGEAADAASGENGEPDESRAQRAAAEAAAQLAAMDSQSARGTETKLAEAAARKLAAEQQLQQSKAAVDAARKELQAATTDAAKQAAARQIAAARKMRQRYRHATARMGWDNKSRPSLAARTGVSRGLGRLRQVDVKTRQRMATLINQILGGGKAGDQLTPIPVTDHRRLVKKMLSRRPLTNAFKEDSNSGRPAILFLPDISPSCAAQAQPACDIANAAGYAGVPGADVLVMPHFNGEIDSSCEEYMPWCNGRPLTLNRTEQAELFADATAGRRFNIKAVVIVGDHDGECLYRQMTEQPKFRHIIWLHNFASAAKKPTLVFGSSWFSWPTAETRIRLVLGCTNAENMVHGLSLAVT